MGPETRDFWLDPRPTHFISQSFDPKHETLKVGPETRDSFYTWNPRPKTQDTERRTWDTYDR